MINDPIADLFTRIRNASLVKCSKVAVPLTQTNERIVQIFAQHGLIVNFQRSNQTLVLTLKYQKNQPILMKLQRLSRPSCRLYVKTQNIPKICGKLGIVLLSTSKGILSDREAIHFQVGGEILGFVA
uniref:Small ribosomal subunit protein uS8c n=1 Tax=Rhipilia penicilloides TaxID=1979422 RepID=A0A2P0QHP9_9CHLO|nr:ribosomal protein S8 [Rhipilia penicilloides]ARO74293.1 ribosomal protein S8 [Rhipilia penicilloides]